MATKWGIAGSGKICSDFVNALQTHPAGEHQVVAVAARCQDSADKFRQTFDVARAYQGYSALAKDPEVEVVYVGSIHPTHLEISKQMLDGGKHVLCEKPLCVNVKETKELVEYARKKGLFLMEAVWSRCLPAYASVRKALADGVIGQVKNVIVSFGDLIDVPRMHKKELGGGTVLDLGIYCIQLAQLAMDKARPERIVAAGHLGSDGVDESTSATLIYSEGRTATLMTSAMAVLPNEGFLIGTKGTIKICSPFWTATEIETPDGKKSFALPTGEKVPYNFKNSANMAFESQHVRECLLKGLTESPLVSLDETLLMAEIMEDIRVQAGVSYPQDVA